MVNEPGATQAVELAHANPKLAVGLHIAVSNGAASRQHSSISPDRRFQDNPAASGIRYFFSLKARREVADEVEEQFNRFAKTGLPGSHVDGHQHLHMHPVVWDAVIRQCEAHGIRRIRIPYEEWRPYSTARLLGRRLEWLFFRALRQRCLRTLSGRGFTVMDRVYGHLESGNMTSEYVLELLERLDGRTHEVYFHPGAPHAQKLSRDSEMDVELHALLDHRIRERIDRLRLVLTTYAGTESVTADR